MNCGSHDNMASLCFPHSLLFPHLKDPPASVFLIPPTQWNTHVLGARETFNYKLLSFLLQHTHTWPREPHWMYYSELSGLTRFCFTNYSWNMEEIDNVFTVLRFLLCGWIIWYRRCVEAWLNPHCFQADFYCDCLSHSFTFTCFLS